MAVDGYFGSEQFLDDFRALAEGSSVTPEAPGQALNDAAFVQFTENFAPILDNLLGPIPTEPTEQPVEAAVSTKEVFELVPPPIPQDQPNSEPFIPRFLREVPGRQRTPAPVRREEAVAVSAEPQTDSIFDLPLGESASVFGAGTAADVSPPVPVEAGLLRVVGTSVFGESATTTEDTILLPTDADPIPEVAIVTPIEEVSEVPEDTGEVPFALLYGDRDPVFGGPEGANPAPSGRGVPVSELIGDVHLRTEQTQGIQDNTYEAGVADQQAQIKTVEAQLIALNGVGGKTKELMKILKQNRLALMNEQSEIRTMLHEYLTQSLPREGERGRPLVDELTSTILKSVAEAQSLWYNGMRSNGKHHRLDRRARKHHLERAEIAIFDLSCLSDNPPDTLSQAMMTARKSKFAMRDAYYKAFFRQATII